MTDLRNPKVASTFEELRQVVIDMHNLINPYCVSVSAAHTTAGVGFEFVEVTGSSAVTVSLHSNPKDKQQVVVKQSGTGTVTVDTDDAATIDGSAAKVYAGQYDCLTFLYSADAGEWIIASEYVTGGSLQLLDRVDVTTSTASDYAAEIKNTNSAGWCLLLRGGLNTSPILLLQDQAGVTRFNFTGGGEAFLNLPTSAGTAGSLWNDSGTVKVA